MLYISIMLLYQIRTLIPLNKCLLPFLHTSTVSLPWSSVFLWFYELYLKSHHKDRQTASACLRLFAQLISFLRCSHSMRDAIGWAFCPGICSFVRPYELLYSYGIVHNICSLIIDFVYIISLFSLLGQLKVCHLYVFKSSTFSFVDFPIVFQAMSH